MVLENGTIILSTIDLNKYLIESLGSDIIVALNEFYDITNNDEYMELKEEENYYKKLVKEKDQEINDLCQDYEYQISELGKEVHRLTCRCKILENNRRNEDDIVAF